MSHTPFYFSSDNGTSRLNSNTPPVLPAADAIISEDLETSKVTTVLLQPENCCRVRTANHVTYSIDTKPKHTVRGSPLWTVQKKNLTTVVFHQIYLLILQTKQTNTTKYKTKKWLYKITTYVWWFQAFAITMQLQISLNLLLVHAANIYIVEFETQ